MANGQYLRECSSESLFSMSLQVRSYFARVAGKHWTHTPRTRCAVLKHSYNG